jgi:hypothetical protein
MNITIEILQEQISTLQEQISTLQEDSNSLNRLQFVIIFMIFIVIAVSSNNRLNNRAIAIKESK